MVGLKVRLGKKGQLVIPKVVRESIGLVEENDVILEVKEKSVVIMPFRMEDVVQRAKEIAKKLGGDTSKWVYGDKLYEEVFG